MTVEKVLFIAKNRIISIILSGLLLAAMSFLFLVTTQKNFKANSDVLVVQNQQGFSDYYALSKSADYLASLLAESIYSDKFIDELNNTGMISSQFLRMDKVQRLKQWYKIAQVNKNSSLGIVNIEVFANDQKEVLDIANAIVSVLTTKNDLFLGRGQDIEVRILTGPLWEKNPSTSQIALAITGGFIVGMLLSFMWAYYREERLAKLVFASEMNDYQDSLEQM
jgi:capsular polysaccharide biosynthesis protein